jgi:PAS domain S-box-containing protein
MSCLALATTEDGYSEEIIKSSDLINTNSQYCTQLTKDNYRFIFDNSLDGIFLTLPDGTILSANPSACRMFGRTEEELCAIGRNGIIDFDDPRNVKAVKEKEKTKSATYELTFIRKDGTKFPGEVTSNRFKDTNNRILSSIIVRDITERKKTEEALHLSEEKFSGAFYHNQTPMSISGFKEGIFYDINDSCLKMIGLRISATSGHGFR